MRTERTAMTDPIRSLAPKRLPDCPADSRGEQCEERGCHPSRDRLKTCRCRYFCERNQSLQAPQS